MGALPVSKTVCRIVVADDHTLFRNGVVAALNTPSDFEVVAEATDGEEAVAAFAKHKPDITILDLEMPSLNGTDAIRRIRGIDPTARVIVLTTFDIEDNIEQSLRAGAKAFLLKDVLPQELIACVRDVNAGRTRVSPAIAARLADRFTRVDMTPQELRVLRLVAEGKLNREIAHSLRISEGTVKVHVTRLLTKLGAKTRTEAAAIAARRGLIHQR